MAGAQFGASTVAILLPVIGLLVLVLAGAGCALLLLPRSGGVSVLEVVGLASVLGSGFVAAISFVLGFFLTGFGLRLGVSVACVVVAALGLARGACVRWSHPPRWVWLLLAAALGAELGMLLWLNARYPLGWDSLLVWQFKARVAAENGGGIPLGYYLDPTRQWSHPEYPLLLPLSEAWLFGWAGGADERLVRVLFGVLIAAMLLNLYSLGSRLGGCRSNGLLAALLLPLVPQVIIGTGGATSGWADFVVGLMYLLAGGYLVRAVVNEQPGLLGLVGALGAMLVWTKQEGVFLWLCLVLTAVVAGKGHRGRSAIVTGAPALIVALGWRVFVQSLGIPQFPDFLPMAAATVFEHLNRVPALIELTVRQALDTRSWALFWPMLAIAIVAVDRAKRRQQVVFAVLVLGPLLPYTLSFVLSAWVPYTSHFDSAMPRLMEHVAPLGVLAIASAAPSAEVGQHLSRWERKHAVHVRTLLRQPAEARQ